ncbi:EscU/YscU/HrcU family type III secretion system export apparatus switch protein [Thermosyntropha sp.]|uniref:EscU/YscU/HrcU family type III secretion system export apparatus switch protein n=1 Tax=Thermosyntropha sp. TaxID=2740820 RepID=UPI0025DB462D|nr:EscU/YscU/HrcU family type III secretion system export apparatus switch protein [Thermosyntropha sp.]MBO8158638.1 EscU/YscU/HrcU family type III secretion system export apparatus switch protein [Thermosyntropha sp.]
MEDIKRKKAVALRYDEEKDAAPRVVAKGRGIIADKIKAVAEEYGVAVHRDEGLADYLMALDLYEEIPPELYPVIAEILAFIYRMDKKY